MNLILVLCHVITHWGWYKGIVNKGIGKKSKFTLVQTVVFCVLAVTGFTLLGIHGANTSIGEVHYYLGLATIVLCVGHIFKRIPLLLKSLKNKAQ